MRHRTLNIDTVSEFARSQSSTLSRPVRRTVSRQQSIYRKLVPKIWPLLVSGTRLLTPPLDLDTISPVLVLGNQKTGSTAIARLLAHRGGLRATTNIHPLQSPDARLENDPAPIEALIQRLRYYFRRDLVKENELTLATDALLQVLPNARFVYVVRHPADNIRSILDRVDLPGHPLPLDRVDRSGSGWHRIVHGTDIDVDAEDHITSLAKRWSYTAEIYNRNRDRLHLVRYEDFTADKKGTISTLSRQLDIEPQQKIEAFLDVSFQPRGTHRSVPLTDFFSADAIATIHRCCRNGMDTLQYSPIDASRHD